MEIVIFLYIFVLGTIFGSFYNVIIYRLPKKISFVQGTSMCPNCNNRIRPFDLVPILSFILLKGKCRDCNHPISIRYPIIELITGLSFSLSYVAYGISYLTLIGMILASICIIVAMIDIDTMEIFDRFHVMILILGLIMLLITPLPWIDHVIGFFIISVPFYIIAIITNGIGGGDIKLVAVAGLLLGYQSMLVAFIFASVIGGSVAVYLLATKQQNRKSLIAFGPYLCIGIYLAYLYGAQIWTWYMQFYF